MKSVVILVAWLVIWGLSNEVLSEPVMEDGMLKSNYTQLVFALVCKVHNYTACLACWICNCSSCKVS